MGVIKIPALEAFGQLAIGLAVALYVSCLHVVGSGTGGSIVTAGDLLEATLGSEHGKLLFDSNFAAAFLFVFLLGHGNTLLLEYIGCNREQVVQATQDSLSMDSAVIAS
jgi:hypothetical protein